MTLTKVIFSAGDKCLPLWNFGSPSEMEWIQIGKLKECHFTAIEKQLRKGCNRQTWSLKQGGHKALYNSLDLDWNHTSSYKIAYASHLGLVLTLWNTCFSFFSPQLLLQISLNAGTIWLQSCRLASLISGPLSLEWSRSKFSRSSVLIRLTSVAFSVEDRCLPPEKNQK